LVDSIRDGSALGRLFGIAYIPRWLIRYARTAFRRARADSVYIPHWLIRYLRGFYRSRRQGNEFIFLIGWFDTCSFTRVFASRNLVYIPHWLIRYYSKKWQNSLKSEVYIPHWLIRYEVVTSNIRFLESLYSSLVDSIHYGQLAERSSLAGLYSSLVDSIRGWSRRPHGELHVYIPHWLIRYRRILR